MAIIQVPIYPITLPPITNQNIQTVSIRVTYLNPNTTWAIVHGTLNNTIPGQTYVLQLIDSVGTVICSCYINGAISGTTTEYGFSFENIGINPYHMAIYILI